MACLRRSVNFVCLAACEPSMLQESHQYGILSDLLEPAVGKDWSSSLSVGPLPKQGKHLG